MEFSVLAAVTAVLLCGFVIMANAWTPEDGKLAENLLLVMLLPAGIGTARVALLGISRLRLGRW
ncbi:hypothetical protein [Micromonospora sp. SL4-19]|uniref:hypothetical protein n=1 Tax=Micromonospora sp. SL4-19 TaxID=3399129 RepID=UPI003A4DA420